MFPITHIRFELRAETDIQLRQNGGAKIRGAIYNRLAQFCPFCFSNQYLPEHWHYCPVCRVIGQHPNGRFGGTAPKAISIQYTGDTTIHAGETWHFDVFLAGNQDKFIPYLIEAVRQFASGVGGIDPRTGKRGCAELLAAKSIYTNYTDDVIVYSKNSEKIKIPPKIALANISEIAIISNSNILEWNNCTKMRLIFLSPVQIVENETIWRHFNNFRTFFHRLLDRIADLNRLYGNGEVIPTKSLLHLANRVKVVEDNCRWLAAPASCNVRDKRLSPTSGLSGDVVIEAKASVVRQLYPYLYIGQMTGVGKTVSKGNGIFRIFSVKEGLSRPTISLDTEFTENKYIFET